MELTEVEFDSIILPYPNTYWITVGAKSYNGDNTVNELKYELHGMTHEPISKEGIEGLGFSFVKQHAGMPDMDFEMNQHYLEWDGTWVVVQEFFEEQELTLFRGKLETMEELRSILKWTEVL